MTFLFIPKQNTQIAASNDINKERKIDDREDAMLRQRSGVKKPETQE
jgi:hypothetical protein